MKYAGAIFDMDGVSDGIYGSLSEALRHLEEKERVVICDFRRKIRVI